MLWLESYIWDKAHIVSHRFAKDNWIGMKDRNRSREKTEKLQKGDWYDKRFDRG